MNSKLNFDIACNYKSASQIARVVTEDWVAREGYCPQCGNNLSTLPNNSPVADFMCINCSEEYELKSKKDAMGRKIVDGAYGTMIERLASDNNPNFFFLNYDKYDRSVKNFIIIPKHFFVSDIIEKRTALPVTARRAGWIGCNILLSNIPESGKIYYIKNKKIIDRNNVCEEWDRTLFLRDSTRSNLRGWLLDMMNCIEKMQSDQFTLQDMYGFEELLAQKHPENKHIKDKIRQQLQFLRDKGYVEFMSKGHYRIKK